MFPLETKKLNFSSQYKCRKRNEIIILGPKNCTGKGQTGDRFCSCTTRTLEEATCREELVPENLAAQEQLDRHEPAGHEQGQFAVPKDGRKWKGIPLGDVPHGFGISPDPYHARVQPQRRQEKGRDGEFQSRKQDCQKVSGKGFEYLLVRSLDAIESPGVLASPLCFYVG